MNSLEKFNVIVSLDKRKAKAKIKTIKGEIYYCKPLHFAEDENDWAYSFFSPDYSTKYFILECNFIEQIEEISDDEWKQHLAQLLADVQ